MAKDITANGNLLEKCFEKPFTFAIPNYIQGLSRSWEESEKAEGKKLSV